jgi:endonuclease/exonuclease/phosphatase family metal-dependent hydrolase
MRRVLIPLLLLVPLAACQPGSSLPEPGTRLPAPEAGTLRVVSYNIRHGRGMDSTIDLERTAAVLRALRPDVVGLQEVDNRVTRSGSVDQAQRLGRLLGMQHAFGKFMDYEGGQYGMAILSRHPIGAVREVPLPEGNEPRVALAVEVRPPGMAPVVVVNVHFDWVAADRFRFAQATALTRFLAALPGGWLLVGDFNDVPGSRTLALFQRRADQARKPRAERFTFPSPTPEKEIDFIFGGPRGRWTMDTARVVTETAASDHRPVVADVRLRRP